MGIATPRLDVRRLPLPSGANPLEADFAGATSLPAFQLMDGSREAQWATATRVGWCESHLLVEFLCADNDAWGTLTGRDQPLWQEEAVELFVAAGGEVPAEYHEFEVSPLGELFDARVSNPHGDRREMSVDRDWNCDGIRWRVDRLDIREDWRCRLALPWSAFGLASPPRELRANFYRIERPRDASAEFSGWLPTHTSPPDFHRPARFGLLRLIE